MSRTVKTYWDEKAGGEKPMERVINGFSIRYFPKAGVLQLCKVWAAGDGMGRGKPVVVHLDQWAPSEVTSLLAVFKQIAAIESEARDKMPKKSVAMEPEAIAFEDWSADTMEKSSK